MCHFSSTSQNRHVQCPRLIHILTILQYEDRAFRVVADTYVTATDGTGIVHQAPAFGEDDARIAIENGILGLEEMPPCPLDDSGKFTMPVADFEGTYIKVCHRSWVKLSYDCLLFAFR